MQLSVGFCVFNPYMTKLAHRDVAGTGYAAGLPDSLLKSCVEGRKLKKGLDMACWSGRSGGWPRHLSYCQVVVIVMDSRTSGQPESHAGR